MHKRHVKNSESWRFEQPCIFKKIFTRVKFDSEGWKKLKEKPALTCELEGESTTWTVLEIVAILWYRAVSIKCRKTKTNAISSLFSTLNWKPLLDILTTQPISNRRKPKTKTKLILLDFFRHSIENRFTCVTMAWLGSRLSLCATFYQNVLHASGSVFLLALAL